MTSAISNYDQYYTIYKEHYIGHIITITCLTMYYVIMPTSAVPSCGNLTHAYSTGLLETEH